MNLRFCAAIGGAFTGALLLCGHSHASVKPATQTCPNASAVTSDISCPEPHTTPSASAAASIPAGYILKSAGSFGVKCDGVTDDTTALQNALNRITSYQALQLPAGTCITSNQLRLYGKNKLMVFGAGKDSTIIQATNPFHSAFVVSNDSAVSLQAFQVYSLNSTTRSTDADSRGFYVEKSSGIALYGVKVRRTAGAGILFFVVTDSKILNSEVIENLSDAFHVTGASQNILVQYNRAQGSGDDCFASIGYGAKLNHNIRFLDNSCSDNQASGLSFEGTIGGQAYRNRLTRTGVAGIRIASQRGYNTGTVSDIDLKDNVLTGVKTRTNVDHAAIMVFTSLANVQNITFANTTVTNPHTSTGARFLNDVPGRATVSNVSVRYSSNTSIDNVLIQCFGISSGVTRLTLAGNTLNTVPCEPH